MNHTTKKAVQFAFGGDRVASLPIVYRELNIAAQRMGTYWTRVSVALVSVSIVGYALLALSFGAGGVNNAGRMLFAFCYSLASWYSIIVGLRNTADCISVEKREGTLGLLLLTDLRGYDVVLGKLCSVGLNSFYGLLAGFPVLAISLVMGGVSGVEFWKSTLTLLSTFFLVHAVGITASVFSTEVRQAHRNAVLLGICVFVALKASFVAIQASNLVYSGSLVSLPTSTRGVSMTAYSSYIWISIFLNQAFGWGLLAFASWRLPYVCQQREGKVRWRWNEFWSRWRYGSMPARASVRQRLLNHNPFFWLTSRAYRQPLAVWLILALVASGWLWVTTLTRNTFPNPTEWKGMMISVGVTLFYLVILVFMASEAVRHLSTQRQDGSLELLLSATPLEIPEILSGYWMTLRRQFLWPIVITSSLAVLSAFLLLKAEYSIYLICAAALLLIDAAAVGWLGMWQGLSAKPKHAAGNTLFRVILLPLLLALPLAITTSVPFPLCFVLVKTVLDLFLITSSKEKLLTNFRLLASPQGEPRSFFQNLGRIAGEKVANWKAANHKENPSISKS